MGDHMKVLAINSSARIGGQSKTELMLNHLVEGMRDAGAAVEVINLHKKSIKNCIGCFTCWTKTPGKCIHKDDMSNEIYPKYLDADLLVLATPLYHFTVNAEMKVFIERTLPDLQPFFELRNGVTRHPMRHETPPVVALSVAGFPDESVFDLLSSYMNFIYHGRLLAEIFRPAAESMRPSDGGEKVADILDATVQGGRELIKSMAISSETMTRIKYPFTDFETMAPIVNIFWQTCIDEGVTPKEFESKEMVPRPDSIETFVALMGLAFNKEKTGDVEAKIQFLFSGEVEGNCYFSIKNGKFEADVGTADNPDLTIDTPFEVWMDITTKKSDGQQMFMEQKYKVSGDMSVLMRFGDFFGK